MNSRTIIIICVLTVLFMTGLFIPFPLPQSITKEASLFNNVKYGMTVKEVVKVMGRAPDYDANFDNIYLERGWLGKEGIIIITFDKEGKITDRALKSNSRSLYERTVEWLDLR